MSVWVPEARGSTVLHRLSFIARGSLYPAAVYCFAANLQVRLGLKSISDAAAKHFVIVRDKNPQAIIGTSGMLLIPSERH